MQTQEITAGSENSILDLVHQLAPAIPARYDAERTQAHFDGVMRVLQVRSEILGRVFNVRKNRAKVMILEGEAEDLLDRRQADGTEWSAAVHKKVHGQIGELVARAEYCQEQIEQWQMEIAAFRALLIDDGKD